MQKAAAHGAKGGAPRARRPRRLPPPVGRHVARVSRARPAQRRVRLPLRRAVDGEQRRRAT